MSEQPPQPPNKPLDYYHSTTPATHPVVLSLSTLGGVIIGIIAMCGAISVVGLGVLSGSIGWMIGAIVLGIAIIAGLIRMIVRNRGLPPERRRTAARFFTIGFLIGCGLGCLLEGLCFAALGNI
jgi:hypothetical protein